MKEQGLHIRKAISVNDFWAVCNICTEARFIMSCFQKRVDVQGNFSVMREIRI